MGDLTLESGQVIKDFAISYVTHGAINAKKSNAILMVTALSGNHHRLEFLDRARRALDPTKYFIICTDAIGNGLTTSPSNSTAQPRMQFPHFTIRDMVAVAASPAQGAAGHRPRGGGDRAVHGRHAGAAVGREPPGLHGQPGGAGAAGQDAGLEHRGRGREPEGHHARSGVERGQLHEPPANGIRLWRDILGFLSARTPEMYRDQFANPLDVLPWLKAQEDTLMNVFDANDYIYQTWAYETHDVGTTAGMNGDLVKALRTIKAKTLMMTGVKDLLNPEWEPLEQPTTSATCARSPSIRLRSLATSRRADSFPPMWSRSMRRWGRSSTSSPSRVPSSGSLAHAA